MAGWAQTIIIGNVGRDPEMRYLQNGTAVCSFSVAVTRKWNDKNGGGQKEKTVWYKVSCWRQLAETANSYVKKGMQIMVVGELEGDANGQPRAYLNNAGQPAAQYELTAQNFQFLGSRGDNAGSSNAGYTVSDGTPDDIGGSQSDDIPF